MLTKIVKFVLEKYSTMDFDRLEINRFLLLVVGAVIVIGGIAGFSIQETDGYERPKVALIVFDGADWQPIGHLNSQGRIPHIKSMMEDGVYTNLSTPRAFSPVSWTKLGTGMSSENISIKAWNVEKPDGDRRMIDSNDVENKRIWNYLNENNITAGVVGYMITWPVQPIKGFMISGPLTTGTEDIIYPEGYFAETGKTSEIKTGAEWNTADIILDNGIHERVDFLTLGFKRLDTVQHQLWKFIVPRKFGLAWDSEDDVYREIIYTEYERLDEVVGRFGEEWNIIIVSDSGFSAEGSEFGNPAPSYEANVNPLLKELGYLSYDRKLVYGQSVYEIDQKESAMKWCAVQYPKVQEVTEVIYRVRLCLLDESINASKAIERLEDVDYQDGRDFFYDLKYRPDINSITGYFDVHQDGMADTNIEKQYINQPTVSGKIISVDKALGLELPNGSDYKLWIGPEKTGDHPPGTNGIFIASGPAIADKGQLKKGSIRIRDIAPTVLYMYGAEIPRDMDGRVVSRIFKPAFNEDRDIRYSDVSTKIDDLGMNSTSDKLKEKALKQRLRNLGYTVR